MISASSKAVLSGDVRIVDPSSAVGTPTSSSARLKRLIYIRDERFPKSKTHHEHNSRSRYQVDAGSLQ